ncbi:MAG: transcription antitermination factor NusB [Myxococcales bacterium]|nr:transcription antitermination factor NusB [Myxococcales bacterium]
MRERRRGREAALQMLFEIDAANLSHEAAIADYWEHLASSHEGREFADTLVRGVCRDLERIDGIIRGVSRNWRIERMGRVDRNVIRLATFELEHMHDIPRRVTLNEAVELAKRYGSEQSAAFVNGVLDRIASDLGKD